MDIKEIFQQAQEVSLAEYKAQNVVYTPNSNAYYDIFLARLINMILAESVQLVEATDNTAHKPWQEVFDEHFKNHK